MPMNAPSKEEFTCAACGADYARETAVHECRICHRTYCEECIDERGICVPCKEKQK
jgi:uncharacterized protein YbcC (UPF0753/DUF2309 family)